MKNVKLTLQFKVEDKYVAEFAKTLITRMHKYLAKYAVTVHKVDMEYGDL